jgi:hypothetical protein
MQPPSGQGGMSFGTAKGCIDFPNTFVVNAENGQIFGLDAVHVGGVCNGEGTTPQVIVALGGINERF